VLNTSTTVAVSQHHCVVSALVFIRKQSINYLPIGHSFIPYDILITVVDSHTNNKELTVKALFASLPYSDMGLRYHFRKLLNDGWIELQPMNGDKRVKQIKPSEKLSNQFELFLNSIKQALNTESFQNDN
jgi:hypothetical protein